MPSAVRIFGSFNSAIGMSLDLSVSLAKISVEAGGFPTTLLLWWNQSNFRKELLVVATISGYQFSVNFDHTITSAVARIGPPLIAVSENISGFLHIFLVRFQTVHYGLFPLIFVSSSGIRFENHYSLRVSAQVLSLLTIYASLPMQLHCSNWNWNWTFQR